MKILNLNLFFYPESIGGATVVAEKMAWGLQQGGHDVTSVYLPRNPAPADFTVRETPFGRSVGMRNSPHSPANRFVNPAATSTLHELVEVLRPDRIVVHAVQHMGVQRLLADPVLRAKTILVVHDFYWMCLQGFRNLPDGSNCNLRPNGANCRQCAWFPGLTDSIYAASREILSGVRAAVFPSQFLHDSYVQLLGERYDNFVVQANPDKAETIIPDPAVLPPAPGAAARAAGKTVLGFVGGPGETKGWELVRAFMQRDRKSVV